MVENTTIANNTLYGESNGIYGVEVAANYYFGKSVSELTLLECASLASIAKAPSNYAPDDNAENNKTEAHKSASGCFTFAPVIEFFDGLFGFKFHFCFIRNKFLFSSIF